MTARLPESLHVLERGWLSSNNILCFDGEQATLVDSGYVTHAAQTVALVRAALGGRRLTRATLKKAGFEAPTTITSKKCRHDGYAASCPSSR